MNYAKLSHLVHCFLALDLSFLFQINGFLPLLLIIKDKDQQQPHTSHKYKYSTHNKYTQTTNTSTQNNAKRYNGIAQVNQCCCHFGHNTHSTQASKGQLVSRLSAISYQLSVCQVSLSLSLLCKFGWLWALDTKHKH
jgi:hypothetical protein